MEMSERRIIGALILLAGLTFVVAGLYSDQVNFVFEMMKKVFETAVAGAP